MRMVPYVAMVVMLSVVAQSGDMDMSHPEHCFALTQKLHASQFELDSVTKVIEGLKSKVSILAEAEDRSELSLSEESMTLLKLKSETAQLIQEANRAKQALSDQEKVSIEYRHAVNESVTRLHSLEHHLADTKRELDDSMSLRESKESEIRKNDLRKQMLVNDIDASNHTISDAYRLLVERGKHRANAVSVNEAAHEELFRQRLAVENATASLRSISQDVEQVQRKLASAQEVLFSQVRHREELQSQLDKAHARLDSDHIEEVSKLHRLGVLRNTTVSHAYQEIGKLNRDIKSVTDELGALQHETSIIQSRSMANSTSREASEAIWNTGGLESALRDSRRFLSQEGYSYRFPSFLEDGGSIGPGKSSTETNVVLLKDSSRILSLQYELQDLETARMDANQTLAIALMNLNQSQRELDEVRRVHLADLQALQALNSSMSNFTNGILINEKEVQSLRNLLEIVIKRKEVSEAEFNRAHQALTRADANFAQTSTTLRKLFTAERNARKSLIGKMEELHALLAERISVMLSVSKGNSELYELDLQITQLQGRSKNVTDEIRAISNIIEDKRKHHTESVAEVAQVARRLEDKLRVILDSEEQIRRQNSKIQDLQSSIESSLNDRAKLKHELAAAYENHRNLQRGTARIRSELSTLECNL